MTEIASNPLMFCLGAFVFGFFLACGMWLGNRILGAIFK